jgi:regulatory protein
MAALARGERTRHQVRALLRRKGYSAEEAEGAVARLGELGYLDDARCAAWFAGVVAASRGWGPRRVRAELARRGVARPVIDAALAAAGGGGVDRALEKLLRRSGEPRGERGLARVAAALRRLGYGGSEIVEALRSRGLPAEEVEDGLEGRDEDEAEEGAS